MVVAGVDIVVVGGAVAEVSTTGVVVPVSGGEAVVSVPKENGGEVVPGRDVAGVVSDRGGVAAEVATEEVVSTVVGAVVGTVVVIVVDDVVETVVSGADDGAVSVAGGGTTGGFVPHEVTVSVTVTVTSDSVSELMYLL